MPHQAVYQINVDGTDVSSAFSPLLLSLTIRMTDGTEADTAEIELDDSYGQIALPRVGAQVSIALGWSDQGGSPVVFEGFLDEPKSKSSISKEHMSIGAHNRFKQHTSSEGSREQGRVLSLSAKSADMGSKVKEQQEDHLDDSTLQDAAQKWAGQAGLTAVVSSDLASIKRAYWSIANESFMAWGARIAREVGATFKIFQSTAVFAPRTGNGQSASGQSMSGVEATWGVNLITWSIAPDISRAKYGNMRVRWYDPVQAMWQDKTKPTSESGDGNDVTHTHKDSDPDEDQADDQADSNVDESDREQGGADSVEIDGNSAAQPQASCTVSGVRPGVDGDYVIKDVVHSLNRSRGWTTRMALRQPSGSAGTDSRDTSTVPTPVAPETPPGPAGIGHQ